MKKKKLGVADVSLTRRLHFDVVGLEPQLLRAVAGAGARIAGDLPHVVALIEDARIGDVVLLELGRLGVEEIFGIAQMRLKIRGHVSERLVDRREDALPGLDDRVRRIRHVEAHGAVVGVHDHLDAVADVVEGVARDAAAGRITARVVVVGVRQGGRSRIGIEHVDEAPARGHDQIRILVVPKVRRDFLDALLD